MAKANATRGTSGNRLIYDFDVCGHGIQVDNSYRETKMFTIETPKNDWKSVLLVNLINSNDHTLNKIGKYLESKNYDLFSHCEYTKLKNIFFVFIDGKEFRVKGQKIIEM